NDQNERQPVDNEGLQKGALLADFVIWNNPVLSDHPKAFIIRRSANDEFIAAIFTGKLGLNLALDQIIFLVKHDGLNFLLFESFNKFGVGKITNTGFLPLLIEMNEYDSKNEQDTPEREGFLARAHSG